jgi:hypothetical protein
MTALVSATPGARAEAIVEVSATRHC